MTRDGRHVTMTAAGFQKLDPANKALVNLCLTAKRGSKLALKELREKHKMKVYTNEELMIINDLLPIKETRPIIVPKQRWKLTVPIGLDGLEQETMRVDWLRHLMGPWYQVGLSANGTKKEWVLRKDSREGFIPLFQVMEGIDGKQATSNAVPGGDRNASRQVVPSMGEGDPIPKD